MRPLCGLAKLLGRGVHRTLTLFDRLNRLPVHPGCAALAAHSSPCFPQNVTSVDPVVQRMEPPRPTRLAHTHSWFWSCRTFSLGVLVIADMPSHLPPFQLDQSRAPSLHRVILHGLFGTTGPRTPSWLRATSAFRLYTHGLCLTRLPGRVSPVPHCSFPTCHRLRPQGGPPSASLLDVVCCLRREMIGSALPNTFRLRI
jgi:hypothetical protein